MRSIRENTFAAVRLAILSFALPAASLFCATPGQAWTLKVLYYFNVGSEGDWPAMVRPLLDQKTGDIYGTTVWGGDFNCYIDGCGVVFRLTKGGTLKVLHTFSGGDDGSFPVGGLIRDAAGSFYGTATRGDHSKGVVFRLAPDGTFTALHTFTGGDQGDYPVGLVRDAGTGDLFGMTLNGGVKDAGIVYRLSADGTFTVLRAFAGSEGYYPNQLLRDKSGNIYGTTNKGGDPKCACGTVYKLAPDGAFTLLHTFTRKSEGSPWGAMTMDKLGNVYGTGTSDGGKRAKGSAFRIAPDGTFEILHRFNTLPDAAAPDGNLLTARSGLMYGTSFGSYENGYKSRIFSLAPDGTEEVAYELGTLVYPTGGGLSEDKDGNLYGTTIRGLGSNASAIFELVK
jgi:uncharacterized repeat protein (TIGR03803 family)